jgi:hypothetical protein
VFVAREEATVDGPTYENQNARLDKLDGLILEIDCYLVYREVLKRFHTVAATATRREAARQIIEKYYRCWRLNDKPRLWPWKCLLAD